MMLFVSANEYLDARIPAFSQAEAAGLVKWDSQQYRIRIDPAAADVILRVQEFQEAQARLATMMGDLFPVPSLKIG